MGATDSHPEPAAAGQTRPDDRTRLREAVRRLTDYEVIQQIGAGGAGAVFKARQVKLDRLVAIKLMPRFGRSGRSIQKLEAEARAAAKLNHPNVVQAYDVGAVDDFQYFVMEYVEGETVAARLFRQGAYDEAEACRIARQVAEALAHAHDRGLLHCDVKPHNVIMTRDGVAKLADLGLARSVADQLAQSRQTGRPYGTPNYLSPEQVRATDPPDFRTDIYGLGATLYHMLTGRPPFTGLDAEQVMAAHVREPLTPPDHVNADISTGMAEVIEMMMAKRPSRRYASMRDLIADLKSIGAGAPPQHVRTREPLARLAALEEVGDGVDGDEARGGRGLTDEPLFWMFVGSAVLNLLLLWLLLAR